MKTNLSIFLCFLSLNSFAQITFEDHLVYENAVGVFDVFAADLNGDGAVDLISGSRTDNLIAWYENQDGQGDFGMQQIIDTIPGGSTSVVAIDLDGDGDLDVVSNSFQISMVLWYENLDGLGNFGPPNSLNTGPSSLCYSVDASDMDGDGDNDIVFSTFTTDAVGWFENLDGLGNFNETNTYIATGAVGGSAIIHISDLDADGDMDVVSGATGTIAWHENIDGYQTYGEQQNIDNTNSGLAISTADFDDDGDNEVVVANNQSLVWYEHLDGQGAFDSYQTITTDIDDPTSIFTVDLDNDGDADLLSASDGDNIVAWYENLDGLGNFGVAQIISSDAAGPKSVITVDIDNDGDMDVVTASSILFNDGKIVWYENLDIELNEIYGQVQIDVDANGCDVNDVPVPNLLIETNDGVNTLGTFTQANGFYQLFPAEGNFTTTMTATLPNYYSGNPSSYFFAFVGNGNTELASFCLEPIQTIDDLNIVLLPLSDARPGFRAFYQLVFQNAGTTQLNGTVSIEYEVGSMEFVLSSDPPSTTTTNTLSFDFENLNPFESRTINLAFDIFPPPTVEINDNLDFTASITPIAGDLTEANNVFDFDQTVVGSFDPNDITVLEGPEIYEEDLVNYLHYLIRFQNTGTADAINVRVENTLDQNLDWSSLQIESTSHSNRVEIVNENQISFLFDEIYLPDSTTNEPASHGFIAYKIKPKADLVVGDILPNVAAIFFDFNEPIITNTATTEVVAPVSATSTIKNNFSIYPIPVDETLTIQYESNITKVELYNHLGQLMIMKNNSKNLDVSSLCTGLYYCRIEDKNGLVGVVRIVKN